MEPMMTKTEAAELVRTARIRAGLTWAEIAARVDKLSCQDSRLPDL